MSKGRIRRRTVLSRNRISNRKRGRSRNVMSRCRRRSRNILNGSRTIMILKIHLQIHNPQNELKIKKKKKRV